MDNKFKDKFTPITWEKDKLIKNIYQYGLFLFIWLLAFTDIVKANSFSPHPTELNLSIVLVIVLVGIAVILFFLEPIRLDILALAILVVLVILEPWTKVSVTEGLSGFSNPATITVLAMFILGRGIERSGLIQIVGEKIAQITKNRQSSLLAVITYLAGTISGFLNNTPVVALFIPMVTNLAHKAKISPSKVLIPLSYASMIGGTLTLIGTSTNLLASDVSTRLIGYSFSVFEFTKLGFVLLIFGCLYLIFLAPRLIPARINPEEELMEEYQMASFLTEVIVEPDSSFIGKTVGEVRDNIELDLDIIQIVRAGQKLIEPLEDLVLQSEDILFVRTDRKTLLQTFQNEGISFLAEKSVKCSELEQSCKQKLVEAVIPHGSFLEGQSLIKVNFLARYQASVLAIRRGSELTHKHMAEISLKAGDVLLLLSTESTIKRLRNNHNFIISKEVETEDYRSSKMGISLGILLLVIALAAFNIIPIAISALAGVIAMVATGCIKTNEIYEAINWKIIFLLIGLIPLGIAVEKTGTASYLANQLLSMFGFLSPAFILTFFYLFTALLTNIISNNASVVLMIPIAVDTALKLGANPLSFVLVVTFAASTAFLTPIAYQTNLMVYGPGGYRFKDFFIVGAPLQLLLAILTPLFIILFWGL